MNVSITPELEKFVQAKVASGMYQSASELVREALRLLEERDELRRQKREAMNAFIQVGLDSKDADSDEDTFWQEIDQIIDEAEKKNA